MARLELFGRISLDGSQAHGELRKLNKSTESLGKSFKDNIGRALSVAAVTAALREVVNYADGVAELTERIESNTEAAQRWLLAANLNGVGAEFVASNFQKMEKALLDAAKGVETTQKSLNALGIESKEFKTIRVDEAMERITEPMLEAGSATQRAAAMLDIFGKSASKVRVVIGDMPKANRLSEMGFFPSREEIQNVKAGADAWTTLLTAAKARAVKEISPGGIAKNAYSRIFSAIGIPEGVSGQLLQNFSGKLNRMLAGGAEDSAKADREEAERKEKNFAALAHMATQERILQMEKETSEVYESNRVSRLTKEQRLNELLEQQLGLTRALQNVDPDSEKAANIKLSQAKIFAEMSDLQKPSGVAATPQSILTDSLRQQGNFLGSAPNAPVVKELSAMHKQLEAINKNTRPSLSGPAFPRS